MTETLRVRCCIVGGGPAGMMLGYLLGRAGVDTVVLEKHADFLRDFRGDTVHPSTLTVMTELGLIDEFLRLPHSELRSPPRSAIPGWTSSILRMSPCHAGSSHSCRSGTF
jgi:FAD binding domain